MLLRSAFEKHGHGYACSFLARAPRVAILLFTAGSLLAPRAHAEPETRPAGIVVNGLKLGSYGRELDGVARNGRGEIEAALAAAGFSTHRRVEPRDVVLGGQVHQVACTTADGGKCGFDVEFFVVDPSSERALYRARIRYVEPGITSAATPEASSRLVRGAADRLAARPRFQSTLEHASSNPYAEAMPQRSVRGCETKPLSLPNDSPAAISATALVRTTVGQGSAVVISPDGYLLTAAHVVGKANNVVVRRKDGREVKARVVRLDTDADVALLHVATPGFFASCLGVSDQAVDVGRDVYAIGAPAGEELSFSISRGIVSGVRTIAGRSYLQTDASINPGNSGGPLLDSGGRVLGVVSWKLADTALEGLGFAVPVESALESLALDWGTTSSPALTTETRRSHLAREPVVDPADPPFDFVTTAADRAAPNPHGWAGPTLGVGILLGTIGATTGIIAVTSVGSGTSYSDRQTADDWAVAGFVTAGVGAAAILTAVLVPALGKPAAPRTAGNVYVTPLVGPTLGVNVNY